MAWQAAENGKKWRERATLALNPSQTRRNPLISEHISISNNPQPLLIPARDPRGGDHFLSLLYIRYLFFVLFCNSTQETTHPPILRSRTQPDDEILPPGTLIYISTSDTHYLIATYNHEYDRGHHIYWSMFHCNPAYPLYTTVSNRFCFVQQFFQNQHGETPEELYGADSFYDSLLTRFIRKR